jgi:hypothetical protein
MLRNWLEECYRVGASHMLLILNREDFSNFPVKVFPHENLERVIEFYRAYEEYEVLEVYSMSLDMEAQLQSDIPVFNEV